jgi:glycosyltransferase involved in cell wall biosynthesis
MMDAAGESAEREGYATVVITCCNRPDKLDQTLSSIVACDTTGIAKFVIIEDSACMKSAEITARILADFPHIYLKNAQNIGQVRSVDRAYAHVKTPYIFHCEEDWVFPSSLFLEQSRILLDALPEVHSVMLRDVSEWFAFFTDATEREFQGVRYVHADPRAERRWGSFSFNPGLRRLSDYLNCAPFAEIGPERDISFHHKMRGFSLVSLCEGDVRHLGSLTPTEKKDEKARKRKKLYLWKSLQHRLQFLEFKYFQ